ncbi:hypothetical protein [Bradyrhizobium embrapense]
MTKLSTVAAAAGSVMFFSLKRASALDEFACLRTLKCGSQDHQTKGDIPANSALSAPALTYERTSLKWHYEQ